MRFGLLLSLSAVSFALPVVRDVSDSLTVLLDSLSLAGNTTTWPAGFCNETYNELVEYTNDAIESLTDDPLIPYLEDLLAEATEMINVCPLVDEVAFDQLDVSWVRGGLILWYEQLVLISNGGKQVVENIEPLLNLSVKDTFEDLEHFTDCSESYCQEMVVLPTGNYTMGGTEEEHIAINVDDYRVAWESPRHNVLINKRVAYATHEVTVENYAKFIEETSRDVAPGCLAFPEDPAPGTESDYFFKERNWSNPGFPNEPNKPVVCVTRADAEDYAKWLSAKTNQTYRLPTEAEFEYAARAGSESAYYWGNNPDDACSYAAVYDVITDEVTGFDFVEFNCSDGNAYTAEVGSYIPNDFGLYDILGNSREWVSDYWEANYDTGPYTEEGRYAGVRQFPVIRGGAWDYMPQNIRSSYRSAYYSINIRSFMWGFRVVRELD